MLRLSRYFARLRDGLHWLRRIGGPLTVPLASGVVAAMATAFLSGRADPDALRLALATLITANAVGVGMVYSTMRTVTSFTAKTDERDSYAFGAAVMVATSLVGVLTGIVHLAWSPEQGGLLPFVAFCLVSAPVLVPVLAVQERLAQRAETREAAEQAAQRLSDDEDDTEAQAASTDAAASGDSGLLRLRRREFVADPSAPFRHDVLGREPWVKAFCAVLAGIESPAVLSLDAGWGTGKTAFVRMCSAWMRSDASPHSDMAVAEFNAWTEGYTGEPLEDIAHAVTSQITDADSERRKRIARLLAEHAARVASGGMVPDGVATEGEGPRRDIARFKRTLRNFAAEGGGRLVVFVDELERCRPDYAIGVLEKVRHIFDVAGVVVVLAVNRQALEHAVGGLHGSTDAAERYMRRFVDQAIRLPDPSDATTRRFLEHLYNETGVGPRMERDNYRRQMFETLAKPEHSSLRDLEQAVHRAAFVLASIPLISDDPMGSSNPMWAWEQAAMTLMILREVNREVYRRFVSGYGDAFDAGMALRDMTGRAPIEVAPEVMERMELVLLLAKRSSMEPRLNEQFWNRYNEAGLEEHGRKMKGLYAEFLSRVWREPEVEHLAGLIEMTAFHGPEGQDAASVEA